MGLTERIKDIELELSRTQHNKATTTHIGMLKSQLARLRTQLMEGNSKSGGPQEGFDVQKNGDGRVCLIGFPSVGKSSLLGAVTDTKSEVASYEFTTLTCIPGNVTINDIKIQMLDLPGIIEGAASGKGRGREVIAVARSADLILMVLDAAKESNNQHRNILTRELETMGIRLNKQEPDIYFRKKTGGGIKFNATVPLTELGDDPADTVGRILHSYRVHHAEFLVRENINIDDVIDCIEGNRKYVRCLYCYNKIDSLSLEEVDTIARMPDSLVMSVHLKLNLDYLLQKMWDYMGLQRVYTKRRGQQPDLLEPVVLSTERHGISVEAACKSISSDLLNKFNFALVWGTSTKYNPQRVGLAHVLHDEDVLQVVAKTLVQQKQSKDYVKTAELAMQQLHKDRKKNRGSRKKGVRIR